MKRNEETIKALLNDPNIVNASKINNQDWIGYNNEKLKEITENLGAPSDELLLPAVSWIDYLLKNELKG